MLVVDVSNNNPSVDFETLYRVDHVDAFISKVSEGITFVDAYFSRRWQLWKQMGLPRGAYHFANPYADARESCRHYLACVDKAGGFTDRDVSVLDYEKVTTLTPSQDIAWIHAFAAEHRYIAPETPLLLYSYRSFLLDRLHISGPVFGMRLWVADFSSVAPTGIDWWGWQYTDRNAQGVDESQFPHGLRPHPVTPHVALTNPQWQAVHRWVADHYRGAAYANEWRRLSGNPQLALALLKDHGLNPAATFSGKP